MEGEGGFQEAPKNKEDKKEEFLNQSDLEHFTTQDSEYSEEETMGHMVDTELQEKVQNYISSFRNMTSRYLPLGVGQSVTSICFDEGVLINVEMGRQVSNSDNFLADVKTITEAFNKISIDISELSNQKDIDRVKQNSRPVDGTYIALLDSVLIVKGKENEFWSTEQVTKDVDSILNTVEKAIEKDNESLNPKI